jgi:hypothetical protein
MALDGEYKKHMTWHWVASTKSIWHWMGVQKICDMALSGEYKKYMTMGSTKNM